MKWIWNSSVRVKSSFVLKYQYWILGHEAAGVVVKIGSGVKDLPVGSKIAIENHFYCENCYTCEVSVDIIQMNKHLFDSTRIKKPS